jgi:predicted XRE-type DNA-binding protein
LKGKTSWIFLDGVTMSKVGSGQTRCGSNIGQSARKFDRRVLPTAKIYEQWISDVDEARKVVARQIVTSVKSKWRTAVALEAATGISRTEISRIKNGNLARFSLERLVWLLAIIDLELEVELQIKLTRKHKLRSKKNRELSFQNTTE